MSNNDTVQLEKAAALDGKSVVIYITNGEEAQSTSPDFYHVDITYQDDEYTVPASIQLATKDRSDVLYLSRDEQHYEKGLGDESTGLLGNDTQRFTVEYVSINGIKIESTDLTTIKNLMQATSVGYEVEKQRDASNPMKIVDEEDKPVKKYKKKKKGAVKKTTILDFLSTVIGDEYEEDEDGYLYKANHDIPKEEVSIQDEMVSYEVVYEPLVKDAHNQWMSAETIEKGCENFNQCLSEGIIKSNLFHLEDTDTYVIEKTWVQPELDLIVKETGEEIKAGTWVAKVKYLDEDLWMLKKAGIVQGLSMQCLGKVNKDTGEITDLDFNITDGD